MAIENSPKFLSRSSGFAAYAPAMPQPAPSPPSSNPTSFAGLLASFAAPGQKKPPARDLGRETARDRARDRARDPDGLEDDVATLSYERALRAHARYHAPEEALGSAGLAAAEIPAFAHPEPALPGPALPEPTLPEPSFAEPLRIFEADPMLPGEAPASADGQAETNSAAQFAADAGQNMAGQAHPAGLDLPAGLDRNLKTASITIRLSPSECAQLRRRAAEAGLTVSAYLRSCTFETEALRALVKDTLAKMRADGMRADGGRFDEVRDQPATPSLARRWWRELLARFWPRERVDQRVAQA
jgi:predicted DNA binding CopG/RHH family protein